MKTTATTSILLAAAICAHAEISTMAGFADVREAAVWARFDTPAANASAQFFESKNPEKKFDAKILPIGGAQNPAVAKIALEGLSPSTEYTYVVSDGKSSSAGKIATAPDYKGRTPPPDFSFVVLGANHVNDPKFDEPFRTPGGDFEILDAAKNKSPAFALWVGAQNVYRHADSASRFAMASRLADFRAFKPARALLNSQANYGVLGANTLADSSVAGAKNHIDVFGEFWCNPQAAESSSRAYSFSYADADFFVLDDFSNSSNLDYKNDRPVRLGDAQMRWLFSALLNSKATFKFIVMNTPVANPVESPENFTFASRERNALLAFLSDKKIEGVIVLSSKKGYAEITRFIRAGAYPVFELSAGPLTDRPAKEITEMNYFRVPGSSVKARSFAQVKIEGAENNRAATLSFFDSKGERLFETTIKHSDLKKFD